MNLIDALEILRRPLGGDVSSGKVFLACGFTPIHLKTFLEAELRLRFRRKRMTIETGLFGDLLGNVERLNSSGFDATIAVLEWADLDPRLGIRSLGGWQPSILPDIVASAERAAARLVSGLVRASGVAPVAVSMPTLPLPPLFYTQPGNAAAFELHLHQTVAALAVSLSEQANLRVLNSQELDELSAPARRLDVKSEIVTGFPYTLEHASALAESLARLIDDRAPRKGLITDLDDTLWAGIVGEDGVSGISWDLEHHTHMHGLYQQFLASLAGAGVLVAVASKNDPALVDEALQRSDLLVSRKDIFPLEVHWSQKSESVRRILETWNVGAGAVAFVDDSPMEAAEVKAAFPEMECLVFPKNDYEGVWKLLKNLRGMFGKPFLTDDDSLRLQSIRKNSAWRDTISSGVGSPDDFLKAAEGAITFNLSRDGGDKRAFELVNKTNQFNLNGKRFSESEWLRFFNDPAAFLLTAAYEDKYGALGKIAVLLGNKAGRQVNVSSWVMSCRAFSRRIEHQCLNYLFEELGAEEIVFDYRATPRNGPLREFFEAILGAPPVANARFSKELFAGSAPPLFHQVRKAVHV